MKNLLRLIASLCVVASASIAFATTLSPIQLLNPAGSTSGQTIVSTGASSAPAWATVPLAGLSSIAANTVLANVTSASAAPVAFSMPSCSSSTSVLQYTTNTGFTCDTSLLTAGSPASFSTIAASGLITPTSSIGIKGTTAADSAQAGSDGEFAQSNNGTATTLTTNTPVNLYSVTLTAGDWDVYGSIAFVAGTGAVNTAIQGALTTTSATLPGWPAEFSYFETFTSGASQYVPLMRIRVNVSSSTTVYCVGNAVFSGGTETANCSIAYNRRR
jgi:hypothetical protein